MFILVNKVPGPTSHDIINSLRRLTGIKTIGHAGTLDPFAQGLLIIGLGRDSTRQLNSLLKLDKTYLATLQLGAVSDTYDRTGKITQITDCRLPASPASQGGQITDYDIKSVLSKFIGPQLQLPPIYSAKKINGQPLYRLARQGQTPDIKPHLINIYDIKLTRFLVSSFQFLVSCSSGAYIRALAHDIGQKLGTGAYLTELIRTQIGPFNLNQAVSLDRLTPDNWPQYIIKNLPVTPPKTKVLVFGTFDRLHPGHINFLNQAKAPGDELYIVIARDANVKIIKNHSPYDSELIRLHNLKSLNLAADIMLGSQNLSHRYRILNKIKPDIIALGYDQSVNLIELKSKLNHYHLNTAIKRLKPYYPEKYKTSKISEGSEIRGIKI